MEKTAIILCGGEGVRLRPYTITIPKPLMPLGNKSILEFVVESLKKNGFTRLIFAVNYRADLIKAYFQDGKRFGVDISYVEENEPLGTVAPLRNISSLPAKFLVMNGDILTNINLDYYFNLFNPKKEFALVPVYKKQYSIEYGVLGINESGSLEAFEEKPKTDLLVSMGVYFFGQEVLDKIPPHGTFGFDDLMLLALREQLKITCPIHEGTWLDIGRHEDYIAAQEMYEDL